MFTTAAYGSFQFSKCPSVSFGSLGLRKLYPMVDVANTTFGAAFRTPAKNIDIGVFHCCSIIFNSTSICPTTIKRKLNSSVRRTWPEPSWLALLDVNKDMSESFIKDKSVPSAGGGGGNVVNAFLPFSSFLMWNLTISAFSHGNVDFIAFTMSHMAPPYGVAPPLFAFTHYNFLAMISRLMLQA